jgi:hypothetical protein
METQELVWKLAFLTGALRPGTGVSDDGLDRLRPGLAHLRCSARPQPQGFDDYAHLRGLAWNERAP